MGRGCYRGVAEVLAAQQAEKIMVSRQLLESLELVRSVGCSGVDPQRLSRSPTIPKKEKAI